MYGTDGSESSQGRAVGFLDIGRDSLAYAFGGLAYKGIALVSVPILARLLSPGELGLLDLAALLATLLSLIAVMGTDQSVAFTLRRSETDSNVWSAAGLIVAASALLLAGWCLVAREQLALSLTGSAQNASVIGAAGIYGAVMAMSAFALNAVRLRGSPRAYATASFFIVCAEMIAALSVAWLVPRPVVWMVAAWAVGASVIAIPVLLRHVPPWHTPPSRVFRQLFRFGAPLVPAAMAWLIGDVWVRSTLASQVDLVRLGEYGIAYRITSVLGLAITGFGVAWYPHIYRSRDIDAMNRTIAVGIPFVLTLSAVAVAITALAPELIAIVAGPQYAGARSVVPALSGAMVALGIFVLVGALFSRVGATRRVGAAALVGVLVQALMAVLLIQQFGLPGAGLSTLSGYATAATVLAATDIKIFRGRLAVSLAIVAACCAAGLLAANSTAEFGLAPRLLLAIGFCVAFAAVGRLLLSADAKSGPA